jgi:microcystin-dependent protein
MKLKTFNLSNKKQFIMIKKLFLLSTITFGFNHLSSAQVGIGNALPNAGSILDLTNTNNKALLLPSSLVAPSSVGTFTSAGMLFYYQDKLFLRTSSGINVLSPWIFDGTTTNGIYVASGTPVGIGIAPLASSTAILTIADASAEVTVSSSTASIVIGDNDFSATHMLIDKDELLVKTNFNTAGTLKFQEDGGDVVIRGGLDAGLTTILTAHGSVDAKGKIKENGNDLLPVGSIIMWNGTTVPAGWALCDGGTYTLDAGGTVSTPNLLDKFIVAADVTGGTNQGGAGSSNGTYAYAATGGANSVVLDLTQIPSHNHSGNTSTDGAHQHTSQTTFLADNDDNDDTGYYVGYSGGSDPQGAGGTHDITNSGSSHSHAFTTGNSGGGLGHENRPPYYALAYIMKL